ncbi:MAG: hypothetical protein CMM50_09545 [Rhodospirillaceae bacterium]|nr:hypothetical protein [Rhodospirillaceae bacterium]
MHNPNSLMALVSAVAIALISLTTAAHADRDSALAALRAEPKIKDLYWSAADVLHVGVLDDGSPRKGYAMYVCEVLREHHAANGVRVRIMDIVAVTDGNWRSLGEVKC